MITAADIDVTIPGEVASVDAAAQWLEDLRDDAEDASGLLNAAALTEISSGEVSRLFVFEGVVGGAYRLV